MPAFASIFNSHLNPFRSSKFSWAELKHAVENPTTFNKELSDELDDEGELISNKGFSSCIAAHDCDRKTNEAIEAHNSMSYLRVDSDDNAYTISSMEEALKSLGINTFVLHSSWSNRENYCKLKALIPLAIPLSLDEWRNTQERLTEALGCDECMNKPAQISYLPATYPNHEYQYTVVENGHHDFNLLPQLRPKPVMQKRAPQKHEGDSMIDEFNSRWDWDFELSANGYKKKGKKWLSPSATSKLAGGSVWTADDGKQLFSTFHTSDPINALGAVDGFAFAALMAGMSDTEMCIELANGELKDWNKQKQKEFAESKGNEEMDQEEKDHIKALDSIFNGQKNIVKKAHPLFGDIKAPSDGCFTMDEHLTPQQQHIKNVISEPQNVSTSKPVIIKQEVRNDLFDTPVDHSIDTLSAPGLVGECIKYVNSISRSKRENLAVSAALSAISVIGGLTHEDEIEETGMNLFCFNVAGSGSGKEAILQGIGNIVSESGIRNSSFNKIKSEQEIYRNLINSQVAHYNIDEIGEVLGKITASKESYMAGIISAMMDIYSKSTSRMGFGGDEMVDLKERINKRTAYLQKKIDDIEDKTGAFEKELEQIKPFMRDLELGFISKPFISISGCTTPETFAQMMTYDLVTKGFVGRSLIFTEDVNVPDPNENFKPRREFPINLSHELKKLRNCGNQDLIEVGRTQNYGERITVPTTPEAKKWLDMMKYNIRMDARESDRTDGLQALYNRQFELVLKVSLILAVGDGKVRTLDHVKWAQKLVAADIKTKIKMVKGTGSDDDLTIVEKTEVHIEKVIDFLKRKGDAFTPAAIRKNVRGPDPAAIVRILIALVNQGDVEVVSKKGLKDKFKYIGN